MREKVELSLYEHLTELDERNDFHLIKYFRHSWFSAMPNSISMNAERSGKEALNDFFLRFLLGKAERAQLQNLFARDFADSGFVNQRRIGVVGAELRGSVHARAAVDNRVALSMAF